MDETAHSLETLEHTLGYRFENKALLTEALTHPSLAFQKDNDDHFNNQRREFLGDAVLSIILAQELYTNFPEQREGFLTRARASLVKGETLASLAQGLKLSNYLRMSDADYRAGNHLRDTALEDVIEAVIGSIYLDGGLEQTRSLILKWYGDIGARITHALETHNPKGRLQEILQQREETARPEYLIVESLGPDHDKTFVVEVHFDEACQGTGKGKCKKEAEEEAAQEALKGLEA